MCIDKLKQKRCICHTAELWAKLLKFVELGRLYKVCKDVSYTLTSTSLV